MGSKNWEKLLLSFTDKKIPQSTKNKVLFKLCALWVYLLMVKVNTNKLGMDINNPKQKVSKRGICIYMAEHNKDFRAFYLNWKAKTYPPADKWLDKKTTARGQIGLDFYHNVICDKRKNWEGPYMYKFLSKYLKKITITAGKDRKRYEMKIPKLT